MSSEAKEQKTNLYSRAKEWAIELFDASITMDSIRDLPDRSMYFFGLVFNLLFISLLITFINSGYDTNRNTKYLVPVENNDPGECESVARPIPNGQYLYDINGNWQGQTAFEFSLAAYRIIFTNFALGQSGFTEFMDAINLVYVQSIASGSRSRTLPENLLYWMSFKASAAVAAGGIEFSQFIEFTGDPTTIFSSDLIYGTIRNEKNDCNVSQIASFDSSSAIMSIQMNTAEYNASKYCTSVIPTLYYINPFFDNVYGVTPVQILPAVDIRSAITSVAVSSLDSYIH